MKELGKLYEVNLYSMKPFFFLFCKIDVIEVPNMNVLEQLILMHGKDLS